MTRPIKHSGVAWIGDIPDDWDVIKLKYITRFVQTKYSAADGDLNYIGLENVISWDGTLIETDSVYERDQSLICAAGDILFGKLRPYLAKVYLNTVKQCCSSEFAVIRMNAPQCPKFFRYQLMSHGFIFTVDSSTYGTKMPRANADFIKNMRVVVPPIDEQQRIAAYLDDKCGRIDSVIAKTVAAVAEYKKLKQAIITRAVIRGIRPNRTLKHSGIEWLGDIPDDWNIVQLKRLAKIQTGNTPSKTENDKYYSQESGYLWIKPEDLGNITPITSTTEYLTEDGIKYGRLLPPNTVYVCCIASVGKVGFCNSPASCNQQINGLIFHNVHWKYGFYVTIAQESEYINNASGNVMKIINSDKQSRLMCPLPPLDEQREIAAYLDEKTSAIDSLVAKKNQLVAELERLKKSLIFEYVTGKKEVAQ